IQERIDPENLSVAIMQSYANFTVGGSLSVNAHGRYMGRGPLIQTVRSLKVVLADGSLLEADPARNADVFYGVIGGYGGLRVIVEVTLALTDNTRLKRLDRTMPVGQFKTHFVNDVRKSQDVVMYNGDIYPDSYATVHSVSYVRTEEPPSIGDRLV